MAKRAGLLIVGLGAVGAGAWYLTRQASAATVAPATGQTGSGNLPASVRANNPGAILYNAANNWQGQVGYEQAAKKLAKFSDAIWGARAQIRLLRTYVSSGHNTTLKIIQRWSGGSNAANYAAYVASALGIDMNDPVDFTTDVNVAHFAYYQAQWEAGGLYFEYGVFAEGASLA